MNKLILSDEKIELKESDDLIEITISDKFDSFDITKIKITVKESTNLKINHKIKEESKIDITFELYPNVNLNVLDFKKGKDVKTQYRYYLKSYSNLNITKFYDCDLIKELDLAYLNGEHAKINYNLKTISKKKQNFDFMVYHNYPNTISSIVHNGVNIKDGYLSFNLTGIVYHNIKDCVLDQNSRIVTFNENKCNINPNLLIEENDVIANHSALIGRFSEEELFYLQSRGIPKKTALNLLVKGFLMEEIDDEEIIKVIDNYWR